MNPLASKKEARTDKNRVIIAVDAMGGDFAPAAPVAGIAAIAKEKPDVFFKIYGYSELIKPLVEARPDLNSRYEIIHTDQVVSSEDQPSKAVRTLKKSSMQIAINAVKSGEADAIISSGNTGVLMGMSVLTLRTLNMIHRPAIINLMPAKKGKVVLLDLGATIESDANNLYQFAIMGLAFAKITLNKEKPSLGLLNVGSEENKGKDSVKLAYSMLKSSQIDMDFHGYVEGDEIALGNTDVIVTDGFTGNIVLKAAQGIAKLYKHWIKSEFTSSFISKIQYLIASTVFKRISKTLDVRQYNGAMLIGLNGIVVKSHGSSDEVSFASATRVAYDLVKNNINEKINTEIDRSLNKDIIQNDGV